MKTSLPVQFVTDQGVLLGRTRNVSEEGLSVYFGEPVLPGTSGRVRLQLGHCVLELQAEVTHCEGFTSGFAFHFLSERESLFTHHVLQVLTEAAAHLD